MEKRSHRFQDQGHNEQGEGAAQRGKGGEAGGVEQKQGVEQEQGVEQGEVRKGGNGGRVAMTAERGGPWFGGMYIHKNITNGTLRTLIGASQ